MPSFEFQLDSYTVGMGWSSDVSDFRWITFESVLTGGSSRMQGTLYFFSNCRKDPSRPVGSFRDSNRLLACLNREDFDAVYAILRTERPIFLRGGGSDGRIEYLELHSNAEPVGEVDTSPGRPIVLGTGDAIPEVRGLVTNA